MTAAAATDEPRAEPQPAQSPIGDVVAMARFFKVLSDPTRLAILRLLFQRPHSVGELVESLGVPQSRVSNHLACLRWCRFVDMHKVSRRVVYRVADERLRAVLDEGDTVSRDQCDHLTSCTRIGPEWI
jgi:ArsR family transcriptional regulator, cadmium/lead-responsive transcriptional repressor